MCGKQENSVQFQLGPRVFRRRHPCVWSLFGLVSWQMIQWVQRPHGSWWVKHGVVCSPIDVFQVFDIQRRPYRQQHSLWETTFNHSFSPFLFSISTVKDTQTHAINTKIHWNLLLLHFHIWIIQQLVWIIQFKQVVELSNSNKLLFTIEDRLFQSSSSLIL